MMMTRALSDFNRYRFCRDDKRAMPVFAYDRATAFFLFQTKHCLAYRGIFARQYVLFEFFFKLLRYGLFAMVTYIFFVKLKNFAEKNIFFCRI